MQVQVAVPTDVAAFPWRCQGRRASARVAPRLPGQRLQNGQVSKIIVSLIKITSTCSLCTVLLVSVHTQSAPRVVACKSQLHTLSIDFDPEQMCSSGCRRCSSPPRTPFNGENTSSVRRRDAVSPSLLHFIMNKNVFFMSSGFVRSSKAQTYFAYSYTDTSKVQKPPSARALSEDACQRYVGHPAKFMHPTDHFHRSCKNINNSTVLSQIIAIMSWNLW